MGIQSNCYIAFEMELIKKCRKTDEKLEQEKNFLSTYDCWGELHLVFRAIVKLCLNTEKEKKNTCNKADEKNGKKQFFSTFDCWGGLHWVFRAGVRRAHAG